jgi:predicted RNA-binding Zn ribbon-like protein
MLRVTGGRWPRNVLIPCAAGEDMFTSRMAHELKIFPYGQNIAVVVSTVMERDRQDAARKRRAVTRVGDPFREAKKAWGGAKSTAPGSSKPPSAARPTAPGPSKSSVGARAAASGAGKLPSAEATKEQRPASPALTEVVAARVADFDTEICMGDYLVGKFFFTRTRSKIRSWCRVGCGAAGCHPDYGGSHLANGSGWGEGCFAGPVVQLLRKRRGFVGRRR